MKKLLYFFCLSCLLISCSNSDDSSDSDPNDPNNPDITSNVFISATVDGSSFIVFDNADSSDLTSSLSIFNDGSFIFVVGGSRLVNQFDNEGLSIGITGPDFNEVNNGFEIDFDNDEGYIVGALYSYTPFGEEPSPDFPLDSGVFRVTSIDKTTQIVSGTFSFTGTSLGNGVTYVVTNGQFENIPYQVFD